jgi:hypothetical protein
LALPLRSLRGKPLAVLVLVLLFVFICGQLFLFGVFLFSLWGSCRSAWTADEMATARQDGTFLGEEGKVDSFLDEELLANVLLQQKIDEILIQIDAPVAPEHGSKLASCR